MRVVRCQGSPDRKQEDLRRIIFLFGRGNELVSVSGGYNRCSVIQKKCKPLEENLGDPSQLRTEAFQLR